MAVRLCGLVPLLGQRRSVIVSKNGSAPRCALLWKVACKHPIGLRIQA